MNTLTTGIPWEMKEDEILKQYVGKIPVREIRTKYLPYRTQKSLENRLLRIGLHAGWSFQIIRNTYNDNYFQTPNPINSYFSGCLAADGSVSLKKKSYQLNWEMSVIDEDLLNLFAKEIEFKGNFTRQTRITKKGNESKLVRMTLNSIKNIKKDLEQHFSVIPNKTKRLAPPNLNNYLSLCYLVGMTDGDGSISILKTGKGRYPWIQYCSSSFAIIKWIKDTLEKNFTATILKRERNIDTIFYNKYRIGGLNAATIIYFLSQLPVPKLQRKWYRLDVWNLINEYKQKYPHFFFPPYIPDLNQLIQENTISQVN